MPDTLVGLCVERSLEMVVGLLGVLKAGAAYIPIDPSYPSERIRFMLEDSGVALILSQTQLANLLPIEQQTLVYLDEDSDNLGNKGILSEQPTSNNNEYDQPSTNHLAYVIYTSGSTGVPKGVMVEHRALVNFLWSMSHKPGFKKGDALLAVTTLSFDIAGLELYLPLIHGGQVVIADTERANPTALANMLEYNICFMQATPATWHLLLDNGWQGKSNLKALCGGEALPKKLADSLSSKVQELWNMYGPTETTIWSTCCKVETNSHSGVSRTLEPIGTPIDNTRIYILDKNMALVPTTVPGDLYIAGAGLARGYLNNDELTSTRFVEHQLSENLSERLYKTGDVTRWLPNGSLEYLGRTDDQVKIRGFRIELGEIETRLSQCVGVDTCVVVAHHDNQGDKRLIAYLTREAAVIENTDNLSTNETDDAWLANLPSQLQENLPNYMVPSAFIVLDTLPLTTNGKVNRSALPAPDKTAYTSRQYIAPQTKTEHDLIDIWADLLSIPAEEISTKANFFELGGHSLLANRMVNRIEQQLQRKIPLSTLFENSILADLAGVIAQIHPSAASTPFVAIDRCESLPLSFGQQRLWFLDRLDGNKAHYTIPLALRLEGQLNRPALIDAFKEIVARHEVLHTHFEESNGEVYQMIDNAANVEITEITLAKEQRIEHAYATAVAQPFDMAQGPLCRLFLFQRSALEHVLLVTMHHSIADGRSMEIFTSELAVTYKAFCHNKPCPLAPLPIQYADFAHCQRRQLSDSTLQQQQEYWQQQLAHLPPLLTLPTDYPRPAENSYCGAHEPLFFSNTLLIKLQEFSQSQGATLYMTLLAALSLLLSRYSQQTDIAIGSPVSNRNWPELENLIGFFVNTLVMRTDISGDPSFTELLSRVKTTTLAAYAHQDIPFESLVERLQPERSLSYTPLFQVMLVLDNASNDAPDLAGLTVSPVEFETNVTKFDVTFSLKESTNGLCGTVEYNRDLFTQDTIVRLINHYENLLTAIVAQPQARLSQFEIISEKERQQLLVDWNNSASPYPKNQCFHELFETQVQKVPNNTALVFGHQKLSYQELNQQANQVAHYLLQQGVTPDTLVGLCVQRSLEMIVGLLGILKSGGAYVPIDPSTPRERIRFILQDSGVRLVVSQSHLATVIPNDNQQFIYLDTSSDTQGRSDISSAQPRENIPPQSLSLTPRHLAYVIYTSGSTGQPKGVMIEHRSWVNLSYAQADLFLVNDKSQGLQFASLGFDAANSEIGMVLMSGGTLHLISETQQLTPTVLATLINTQRINLATLPPVLLSHLPIEQLRSVATLIVAGESISPEAAEQWSVGRQLFNGFGPTESTVCVCCSQLNGKRITIGKPLKNYQVFVVDSDCKPTPIGVIGELLIAGVGLVRGYWNNIPLTQEKFIPHPFSNDPEERVYKTGDLVRWLADGQLEFIGRADNQVKIRGFRIELGEIESRISQCEGITDCVVITRDKHMGDKELVAYLVSESTVDHETDDVDNNDDTLVAVLHAQLQVHLPDYMIPSAFVVLNALPLTTNGKVDRKALPTPDSRAYTDEYYVAPQTEMEIMLVAIWSELLSIDSADISATANFFTLGGHSLLSIRVINRIKERLNLTLSPRILFETPVLADLAKAIAQIQPSMTSVPLVAIDRSQPLALSFNQQRLWFLARLEGNNDHYTIPLALQLNGQLNRLALINTLKCIVSRHEILRTRFAESLGDVCQIIDEPNSFIVTETLLNKDQDIQQACAIEAAKPFDINQGGLCRMVLLERSTLEHILLITIHHSIADGWSMRLLTQELETLYAAFCQDLPCPLAPLPIQYADFACWQRQSLSDTVLQQQKEYWQHQLADLPSLLTLPTDYPRPTENSYQGAHEPLSFSSTLLKQLQVLSQRENATLYMTLISAFSLLLSRYSQQTDIAIGSPINNRNQPELENLIGFFINTLVIRIDVSNDPRFIDLLSQVRSTTSDAYAHQDIPFEYLVEVLQPERSLSHSPLFQVVFDLQNIPVKTPDLTGLAVSPIEFETNVAKFDLTFSLEEHSNGLCGSVEYNRDLFTRETVVRLINHYENLLTAIVAQPQARLSQLAFIAKEERHQLLIDWNNTTRPYSQDQCLHTLFEAIVQQAPHNIALIYDDQQLSYQELNQRANQLAHYLIEQGVTPDTLVGLCIERSIEFVIGALAVLKAGGAYLPLDPSYPEARLKFMLADSQPVLLLSDLCVNMGKQNFTVNDIKDCSQWSGYSNDNPTISGLNSAHLAYVIYTSGSTGRPKGVMVEHRNITNLIQWHNDTFNLQADDRSTFLAGLGFDAAVWELWPPLCIGAGLVIPSPAITYDSESLLEWWKHQAVTVSFLPTPIAELAFAYKIHPVSLRILLIGGDKLRHSPTHHFPFKLINNYGPTETTVVATSGCIETSNNVLHIGKPIANTRIYVLDEYGQPVTIGVVGELYIGGAGVARGYLNHPELTDERFLSDPFCDQTGELMYKTGDLVRWRSDGTIEFMERNDFQVKIRGMRIELGEIESRLSQSDHVTACVVIAREKNIADQELVAYLVLENTVVEGIDVLNNKQEHNQFITALRSQLKIHLPDYMVPSAFVLLNALPLTTNGKVDYKMLPAPTDDAYIYGEYVQPQTEIEKMLVVIWAELLSIPAEEISATANFFDLGGHSLLAHRVMNLINQLVGVKLCVRVLFDKPRLMDLACAISDECVVNT
ncbi:hypothetical protein AB835_13825 [Candidatus Endobugula sertula]|uniref:Carrier domain-containing protein n=1 Tax=Candidatus Endobugula sertula TaxID=62101 RepID=A0A1D2QLQ5_9GAMM|nr:hypothetical protein AB835_13825 [Candidatus Endobugula sertula]